MILKKKPIPDEDSYKYLGIDESISYIGLVNKTRVTKEYNASVKRIWNSEISSVMGLVRKKKAGTWSPLVFFYPR